MLEALGDVTLVSMVICVALSLIGFKFRSMPVMVVSSLGWMVVAFQIYGELESVLPMALIIMLSVSQVLMVSR